MQQSPFNLFPKKGRAGRSARQLASLLMDKKSAVAAKAKKNSSKLTERSGNVHENKGPLW
jgi:hypothetical protein